MNKNVGQVVQKDSLQTQYQSEHVNLVIQHAKLAVDFQQINVSFVKMDYTCLTMLVFLHAQQICLQTKLLVNAKHAAHHV